MPDLNLAILYVADPLASAAFYGPLLGAEPVESAPGFVMFALPSGLRLGLWKRDGVAPPVVAAPGAGELALVAEDVDALHAAWVARGVRIAQPPVTLEFGRTFTALDPDGHRLRALRPAAP